MVAGRLGHLGLSVHRSATPAFKKESDSAVHPHHSMVAAAALGLIYRQENATLTSAQVLFSLSTISTGIYQVFLVYLCGIYTFLYLEKKIERWIILYLLSGVCPEGMMYLTAAECEVHGGACPRVCLDMTPADVQCATTCYDGCYCAPGFYLLNGSCVPLARCPCYHQGETHPAGATLQVDACNNWYSQYLSFPLIICG